MALTCLNNDAVSVRFYRIVYYVRYLLDHVRNTSASNLHTAVCRVAIVLL